MMQCGQLNIPSKTRSFFSLALFRRSIRYKKNLQIVNKTNDPKYMAGTREMIKQQLPEKPGLVHASTLGVSVHPRKRLRKKYIFCEGLKSGPEQNLSS